MTPTPTERKHQEHTKEPWRIVEGDTCDYIADANGTPIAQVFDNVDSGVDALGKAESDHNAARIVECVNACANIPAPADAMDKVREAIGVAELRFLEYAEIHFKKGTPEGDEKAKANLEEAKKLAAALSLLPASNTEGR